MKCLVWSILVWLSLVKVGLDWSSVFGSVWSSLLWSCWFFFGLVKLQTNKQTNRLVYRVAARLKMIYQLYQVQNCVGSYCSNSGWKRRAVCATLLAQLFVAALRCEIGLRHAVRYRGSRVLQHKCSKRSNMQLRANRSHNFTCNCYEPSGCRLKCKYP